MFQFQVLKSRLFQREFDRVNLHRPTSGSSATRTGSLAVQSFSSSSTLGQGLTLVHFSAQRKRFVWDRGCI